MKPGPTKLLFGMIVLSGGFLPLAVRADPPASRSPFQPEGSAQAPMVAQSEGATLELRGIVSTKSGYTYGIFDPTKRQSAWVRMNDTGNSFVVRSHDVNNDTVTVEYQGRTMTLALKAAKVESMAPLPSPAQVNIQRGPNPMPNQPPQPGQPPSMNPSAADEARRLEGVAAEVRRRRMLRQAAAQNGGQPPAMNQPPMPTPQPGGQPLPR